MEIILIWLIAIILVCLIFILMMALSNAYQDTKMQKILTARPIRYSDDKALLSRWELNRKLREMDREQKRLGWRR